MIPKLRGTDGVNALVQDKAVSAASENFMVDAVDAFLLNSKEKVRSLEDSLNGAWCGHHFYCWLLRTTDPLFVKFIRCGLYSFILLTP